MPAAPSPLPVRRAVPDDAAALYELSLDSIRGSAASHYSAPQLEAWAARRSVQQHRRMIEETVTFVAVDAETIAGFAAVALAPRSGLERGEVDQLFVSPRYGGRGIARLLLAAVETAAGEAGVEELLTHASWRAAPVFERLGYSQAGLETVHVDDQVLTRVRMRKPLRADRQPQTRCRSDLDT